MLVTAERNVFVWRQFSCSDDLSVTWEKSSRRSWCCWPNYSSMERNIRSRVSARRRLRDGRSASPVRRLISPLQTSSTPPSPQLSTAQLLVKHGYDPSHIVSGNYQDDWDWDWSMCDRNLRDHLVRKDPDGPLLFVCRDAIALAGHSAKTLIAADKELLFVGEENLFQLWLKYVHFLQDLKLSTADIKLLLPIFADWGMTAAVEVGSYYFLQSADVPVCETLKLASHLCSPLLLEGALARAESNEEVLRLVRDSQNFSTIRQSPFAAEILGRILEQIALRSPIPSGSSNGSGGGVRDSALLSNSALDFNPFRRPKFSSNGDQPGPSGLNDISCISNASMLVSGAFSDDRNSTGSTTTPELLNEMETLKAKCYSDLINFERPDPPFRDYPVVVDGCTFYVSKAVLACASPVFYRIFFSDFADKRAAFLEVNEMRVSPSDFALFLSLIFPTYKSTLWRLMPVDLVNRKCWLLEIAYAWIFQGDLLGLVEVFKLAHFYQVSSLIDFLIELIDQHLPLAEKMLIADQYHLPSLMASCLKAIRTSLDFKHLIEDNLDFLDTLCSDTLKLLLEHLAAII